MRYTCPGQPGSQGSHEKSRSTFGGGQLSAPEVAAWAVQSSFRVPSFRVPSYKAPVAAAFSVHLASITRQFSRFIQDSAAFACQFSDLRSPQLSLPHRSGLGLCWAPCRLRYPRCPDVCSQREAPGDLAPAPPRGSGNTLDFSFFFFFVPISFSLL